MDHLPRPIGVEIDEADRVPCVALDDYRDVPFLKYAETKEAYRAPTTMVDAEMMALYEATLEMLELQRFLQTWLFFCLLQETFGERFEHDDFTNNGCISTAKIPKMLKQWVSDPNLTEERLCHLQHCLKLTYLALAATPKTFDPPLKLSIAATAESINAAVLVIVNERDLTSAVFRKRLPWGGLDDTAIRVARMQERYWCPAQASFSLSKFHSLQAKVYLSSLTKPKSHGTHAACTQDACHAMQIDPNKYESLHRPQCVKQACKLVEMNQEDVTKILDGNTIALLDLSLDPNTDMVTVRAVPAKPDSLYIALSHVWADGLGNTGRNALPQCQLRHIHRLLTALGTPCSIGKAEAPFQRWLRHTYQLLTGLCFQRFTDEPQSRLYLWLDTLCCPVDAKYKSIALARIPRVYREATGVLVLDTSLIEMDGTGLDPIERLFRVFTSGWIFRLWTLNEANLSQRLWIQFCDGVIELDRTVSSLSLTEDPEIFHLVSELVSEFSKLRLKLRDQQGPQLWLLADALRYRSVSEVSDEPICLGAILGLDAKSITGEIHILPTTHEDKIKLRNERMERMWELAPQVLHSIPKSLIHQVGEKLTKPGLRWAPSTLLGLRDTSELFSLTDIDQSRISSDGLILSSAACSISVPKRVDSMLSKPSKVSSTVYDLLKYDKQHWFTIFSTDEQKIHSSHSIEMALYDIVIEDTGAEFDLLFNTPLTPPQDSYENVNCVLVKIATERTQQGSLEMRKARLLRQGRATGHDQITCGFLTSLQKAAETLQQDDVSKKLREASIFGAQDPSYLEAFQQLGKKANLLADEIEEELNKTGTILPDSGLGLQHQRRQAIFALLSRFYRNRYLVKIDDPSTAQLYCVG
jgi:hypothetical protein